MSDLVICEYRKEYGHTGHQISLLRQGVIEQQKVLTLAFELLQMCESTQL